MNIKIIKLVNGDELICDLEESKTKLKVNKPLLLAFQENRLVFVPFMQYTTAMEGFELQQTNVLFVTDPVDSLINDYQMATSQILTPPQAVAPSKKKSLLRSVE
jgi:hypothetical protein